MNRLKKEELKKYLAARDGLTPDEVAKLDRQEKLERELEERARRFHVQLFPEEYDGYYDSLSDSEDRRRGINPMSASYIERTNRRRVALGFSDDACETGPRNDTLGWVREMLAAGREADLQKILSDRKSEGEANAASSKEAALKSDIDGDIDRILEKDTFLSTRTGSPEDLAFRVLGCCMRLEASKHLGTESLFLRQIKRLLPGLPEEECKILYSAALEKWSEIYFPN